MPRGKKNSNSKLAGNSGASMRGVASGQERREGDWDCPVCGTLIFASKDTCLVCDRAAAMGGTVRPSRPRKEGQEQALMAMLTKAMGRGGDKQNLMATLMAAMGGGDGGGGGGGGGAVTASNEWKQRLTVAFAKAQGRGIEKDEITYETVQVSEGGSEFQSTVTIDGQMFNGAVGTGKKTAENNAAQVACSEMFSDFQPKGTKRGADGAAKKEVQPQNPKGKLIEGLSILGIPQGVQVTKDSLAFEVAGGDGAFTASLKINSGTIKRQFSGMGESKKGAEFAAAEAALKALAKQIEPAVKAHKERKKEASKASLAALKERHELIKLQKKADASA